MVKTLSKNQHADVTSLDELLLRGIQTSNESIGMDYNQTVQGEVVDDVRLVDPETVHLSRTVARSIYNEPDMIDLVESVRREGIIMPVIVRPRIRPLEKDASGEWECIKGTRRVLAAREAKVKLPIIVRDMNDIAARRINLVTTLHRSDISAYEKSQALIALQGDMQRELDTWVKESIEAGLVQSTKAKNSSKKPVQIVSAKAWEQVQKEFVEMPAWIRHAFERSVDRRSPAITLEDVAGQVGLDKDTVQKYFSVAKLSETVEEDKLEKATLPELRMAATIKTPSLQRRFVNAISQGLTGKQAKSKLQEIRQRDDAARAKEKFGDTQEGKDALEYIAIKPYIADVTRNIERLSGKLKMSELNERKDYPALEKELISGIMRWEQVIRSIESRQINDPELFRKRRLES